MNPILPVVGLFLMGHCSLTLAGGIHDLIRELDSPDHKQRLAAMARLENMGREALPAIPQLVKFLEPADETAIVRRTVKEMDEALFVREAATRALAKIGEPEVVETLLRFVREHDREFFCNPAVSVFREIDNPKGIAVLKGMFKSRDLRVRRAAVQALAFRDYAALLDALEDEDSSIRQVAIEDASAFGAERAIGPLPRGLGDADRRIRMAAVRELEAIKDRRAIEPLIVAAKDADAEIRWIAVHALDRFEDKRAVDSFIRALKDESSLVRTAAARALGDVPDARALAPLKAASKDEDSFVRRHAEASLKKIIEVIKTAP